MNSTMTLTESGLYIISDSYFVDFPSIRHMDNKHESRPYYYAVKDESSLFWMVPISHKVDKYADKLRRDEQRHQRSVFCYIAKLKGEDRAFLTGNVIPVSDKYIKRPFSVNRVPYVLKNQKDASEIRYRVMRYIALVKAGKLTPAVDILHIAEQLRNA